MKTATRLQPRFTLHGRSGLSALAAALLASFLVFLPTALTHSPAALASVGATSGHSRPNIVVILTDDMRADELRFLPAVRRLQRSGVTFTRAISADSLCCPARATLLTGKLAHNHLTVGNSLATHGGYQVFRAHNDIQDLLPQWLGDRGYRTGWIGKYLNDFGGEHDFRQPDWTYFASPVRGVYDYWSSGFAINGRYHGARGYRELFARHLLLSRVKAWSGRGRPFFVLDSTLGPHKQREEGARSWQGPGVEHEFLRGEPRLRIAPSVGEKDMSDKPTWLQEYAARPETPKTYPTGLERKRVESLRSVNQTVESLVETLQKEHALRDTVLIFTSDNGFLLREHDLKDKNKAYEEAVHVPLIVRGPGFRGGRSYGQTVSLADVTATIRRVAGVSTSHGGDGVPLQKVLADPGSFTRRPVEIEGSAAQFPDPGRLETDEIGRFYSGAIWGPYTLVRYQTGDWEFYDRTVDPWQMDSSYTPHPTPGSPQALLQAWYATHVDCRGPACNERLPSGSPD
jgi:N-acetylglucosamine-6-sulfatase